MYAVGMSNLPGRNEPCHCGSGTKYKRCCADKDEAADLASRAATNAAQAAAAPPPDQAAPQRTEKQPAIKSRTDVGRSLTTSRRRSV